MRTHIEAFFYSNRVLTQTERSQQLAQEYRTVSVKGIEQYQARFLKIVARCVPKSGNLDTLNRRFSVYNLREIEHTVGFLAGPLRIHHCG